MEKLEDRFKGHRKGAGEFDCRITLRIQKEEYNRFANKCKERGLVPSEEMRKLIIDYTNRNGNDVDLIYANLIDLFDAPCNVGYGEYMSTLFPSYCMRCKNSMEFKKKCWEAFMLSIGDNNARK